ncbi:hypothetical protein BOTBODRAFT_51890 [Botryobasidium botryosum FD-172 SS1]|uniref:Uncharacterized protein n=1 Tax=Botryobasidium botryosum (strain FD-172 SS1) TaxID=930990 RepID=A0A067N6U6_BOTB1|nr:hypothetical protein BOTBODRAFT_51890 [Botryobasidium botryosum FD-172 SS1]
MHVQLEKRRISVRNVQSIQESAAIQPFTHQIDVIFSSNTQLESRLKSLETQFVKAKFPISILFDPEFYAAHLKADGR